MSSHMCHKYAWICIVCPATVETCTDLGHTSFEGSTENSDNRDRGNAATPDKYVL